MKKKVLLMGASGSGKTSMRSLIFSNNPASLTSRLGATIDVEQNHVRFLGDLILNLWDCGGQDAFMDSYLTTQRSTIFSHVGVLIYVFDVENSDMSKDLEYYRDCVEGLGMFSPEARVYLLVHKMDLVREHRELVFERKRKELRKASGDVPIRVFGTSIYDESLYKAWSSIVHTLIPNAAVLSKRLAVFAEACSATEVVLFERTTFLVIATSNPNPPSGPPEFISSSSTSTSSARSPTTPRSKSRSVSRKASSSYLASSSKSPNGTHSHGYFANSDATISPAPPSIQIQSSELALDDPHQLNPVRYEKTSELIKAFKHSCSRVREEFVSLEMQLHDFTAVLEEMTRNTYVLVVAHDPTIEVAALRLNIRIARRKFEELQSDSLVGGS